MKLYNSYLIPKIEERYYQLTNKKMSFAQIIDHHFVSFQSLDTIWKEMSIILDMKIVRSTFIRAVKSEIEKTKYNLSDMKYQPQAKFKNNPYRKKHSWKNKKTVPKKNVIFKCQCNAEYDEQIVVINNYYGLNNYTCKKCQTKGNGLFIDQNKTIKLKTIIKGTKEEIIT